MTKTRKSKKIPNKRKVSDREISSFYVGVGTAAALGGLGYGAYKLGPRAVNRLRNRRVAGNTDKVTNDYIKRLQNIRKALAKEIIIT